MIQEKNIYISIEHEPLIVRKIVEHVQSNSTGAEVVFVGRVRNQSKGKLITQLDYSAYKPMALSEMNEIATKTLDKFDVEKIAVAHRVGELKIGELAVVIAISSAHRAAGFKANQYIIDEIKKTVPIWKKEYTNEGDVWVNATP